jgi:polar amino acid transport system permease protein
MLVELNFAAVWSQWPLLLKGVFNTVWLTLLATVIGLSVATFGAWARSYKVFGGPAWLGAVMGAYVELIRNTPFIVQLFFIFFGLPSLGVKLSPEAASVIAMVINLSAYATEIIRAGVDATHKGQLEAAASLGLSKTQTYLRVVLPPAFRKVWPAMVSQIIIVMLGSAVCSQISVEELSFAANLIQSRNFRAFEAFITATAVYLLLSIALRAALNWLGPRFLFGQRRVTKP